MSNPILNVEHISKRYALGGTAQLNASFREMLMSAISAPFKRYKNLSGQVSESQLFWALDDISFNVNQGEVVGIIGKNGAGKSTLLKILSRITTPTLGQVTIKGNVASLLEVGTGFHPELSGRENIYLNGAILGMRRKEIAAKFKDIIEFANIERFVDTPVKRYSSGMYVRLAFSIAAHLEPDILIVDEVLAVGDIEFQKRCLGKLNDIATQGRTVLFVSHNMSAINRLCSRCIYLENGQILADGETLKIVSQYFNRNTEEFTGSWNRADFPDKQANTKNYIESISVTDEKSKAKSTYAFYEAISVNVLYRSILEPRNKVISIRVTDSMANDIFTTFDVDSIQYTDSTKSRFLISCQIPDSLFRPGKYTLTVFLNEIHFNGAFTHHDVIKLLFEITNVGYEFNATRIGILTPRLKWVEKDIV